MSLMKSRLVSGVRFLSIVEHSRTVLCMNQSTHPQRVVTPFLVDAILAVEAKFGPINHFVLNAGVLIPSALDTAVLVSGNL